MFLKGVIIYNDSILSKRFSKFAKKNRFLERDIFHGNIDSNVLKQL